MSQEYPCVYHSKGLCAKFTEPGYVSHCVFGPCSHELPSNADRIRAMSDEELANFLCSLAYARNTPWSDPFARKFCDNCPTVEGTVQETGKTMSFYECDFSDGKCPHGSDVVWWLRQPAEEVH